MDMLKKFFPFSFGVKDVANLIVKILIYIVAGAVIGFVIGILSNIPIVNLVTGIVGTLVEIYITAGIVIAILDFCKVLKKHYTPVFQSSQPRLRLAVFVYGRVSFVRRRLFRGEAAE